MCYARVKGVNITWEGYLRFRQSLEPSLQASSGDIPGTADNTGQAADTNGEEVPTLSFQELSEMIATGNLANVPFNRTIPEAISVRSPAA